MLKKILPALLIAISLAAASPAAPDYAIVISSKTQADPGWAKVAAALREKYPDATTITWNADIGEALKPLQAQFPRHTCFVARPEEATKEFVASVHRITRALDDDPYTDTLWGILTGYDASNALRIARHKEPLTIKRVLSGTPFAIERAAEGIWYSELTAGEIVRKDAGAKLCRTNGPADSTAAIVSGLNDWNADLFITSGHATERDWQIGYRYRNGQFRCDNGALFGLDLDKQKLPVASQHPRVYLPVGNCLMGHITGSNCMALAFMNSAGVMQMIGYTEPTWYGYAGWGMLDYFLEQPGRFTLAEAFVANQNALIHRLRTAKDLTPQDEKGLTFDSEVLAFYGDPAWPARLAPGPINWEQLLGADADKFSLAILPHAGAHTFDTVNANGSQRGGRPIIQFLPHRVRDAKIIEGADLNPLIADDFILIPLPKTHDPDRAEYKVVFQSLAINAPEVSK